MPVLKEDKTVRTSNNPALTRSPAFGGGERLRTVDPLEEAYFGPSATARDTGRMTVEDVVNKTGILLGIAVATGAITWALDLGALAFPAALVGFVLAMVIIFKQVTSPGLIIAYAAVEGVFLGAISRVFEQAYPGIAVQAIGGTMLCFGGVLAAYKTGRLRATPRFKKVIVSAMLGIFALYAVNLVAMLFGGSLPVINDSTPLGILFSVAVVTVAALSFVLDFELIEEAERGGAPERFAWKAAFGLVVGLVWLYLEMLRLLAKLRD